MFRSVSLRAPQVRLEPLSVDHAAGLLSASDDEVFAWLPYDRPTTIEQMRHWVRAALRSGEQRLPFTVIADGQIAGTTSYWYPDSIRKQVEIGSTWLGRAWWGMRINTEAKYLMLAHAFDDQNLAKVALRTDARNVRSQRAIEKLGAPGVACHQKLVALHRQFGRVGSWMTSTRPGFTPLSRPGRSGPSSARI